MMKSILTAAAFSLVLATGAVAQTSGSGGTSSDSPTTTSPSGSGGASGSGQTVTPDANDTNKTPAQAEKCKDVTSGAANSDTSTSMSAESAKEDCAAK